MDILGDVFNTLNLQGSLYFRTDFSPPWGVTVPPFQKAARFHLVLQGRCFVRVGTRSIELGAGDLILIPQGVEHSLAHTDIEHAPPLETVLQNANYQGDGVLCIGEGDESASTQMLCGHLNFRQAGDHPLLRALPDFIHISQALRAKNPLLDDMLRLISQRVFTDALGAEASITRLSEVVFLEILRSEVSEDLALQRVLDAFRDPKIARALQLMHSKAHENWTVESLALRVAMSRSRFAKRFNELMGIGPMSYLSDWRLQKSLSLLENPGVSVQQIALEIGYQSPAAFSRAFAGKFGTSPSEFRRA